MHTVLMFSGGRRTDALLLSASPDRLRVAIPGRGDTVEYRMVEGNWVCERGARMEIGALMLVEGMSPSRFVPHHQARTLSAS
jgi:hypothetical protein